MRLLVAGASGFIGRNLVKHAPPAWEITATYNSTMSFPAFRAKEKLDHVRPLQVDLTVESDVKSKLGEMNFDAIVNLAGNVDLGLAEVNPREDWNRNVSPALNLARYCKAAHLIHFSSGAVYDGHVGKVHPGVPPGPRFAYAISKLAAEHYVSTFWAKRKGEALTVVRFFGAYGPHEPGRKIFSRLVRAFAVEKTETFSVFGDGKNLIDAMYVEDAIRGILAVVERPMGETVIDFGAGNPVAIDELVLRAGRIFGIRNLSIVHTGNSVEYIQFFCDPERFENLYGFRPLITLEEGLRSLEQWIVNESSAGSDRNG